jgi:hypothetical protein
LSSWAITAGAKINKKEIGFKVKRILDYGRAKFIEENLPLLRCGVI